MAEHPKSKTHCPKCGEDAGQVAEEYGHMSGIYQFTNCKSCGQRLVSDFTFPLFFWRAVSGDEQVTNERIEWAYGVAQLFYKKPPFPTAENFKKCCAIYVRDIWRYAGGPMNLVDITTECPECGQFIVLTQTPEKVADDFLEQFELEL